MNGRIQIKIDGTRKSIFAEVGGQMVPVRRVTRAALNLGDPGDLARLEIDLMINKAEIEGGVQLVLADDTRALLIAHGWTEPQS